MLIVPSLMLKKSEAKVESCGREQDLLAAMRNSDVHKQHFRRYLLF